MPKYVWIPTKIGTKNYTRNGQPHCALGWAMKSFNCSTANCEAMKPFLEAWIVCYRAYKNVKQHTFIDRESVAFHNDNLPAADRLFLYKAAMCYLGFSASKTVTAFVRRVRAI